jgi:anaerobic selenocysteine-containing dehydrogenase
VAGIADMWVRPRPASDGALAMGLLKVVVDEELYDKAFVRDHTVGFEALTEELAKFTVADAAKACWVPEEQIVSLARLIGTSKPACLQWGNGVDQGVQPFQTHRAISILAAITGNLNVPGGIILPDSETNFLRPGKFYMLSKRRDVADKTLGKEFPMTLKSTSVPSWSLIKAIVDDSPQAPKAAFFMLTNPMTSFVDSKSTRTALEKLDFSVVLDIFMTPTGMLADLVLPVAFGMEHDEVGYWPGWYNEVRAHPKLVDPPGEARSDTWVINELAKRLGLPDFWEDDHEALDAWIAPSGLTFEDLKRERTLLPKTHYGDAKLRTPSGKVEIVSDTLGWIGLPTLPRWEELGAVPELHEDYPLLFTNSKSEIFVGTSYKGVPALRGMRPEPVVQMNPETARGLGLADGDLVWMETKKGRIKQRLVFDPDMDPRVLFADFGWWFPEDPSGQFGWDWGNINVLTSYDEPVDPAVGVMIVRGVPCRVYKAESK